MHRAKKNQHKTRKKQQQKFHLRFLKDFTKKVICKKVLPTCNLKLLNKKVAFFVRSDVFSAKQKIKQLLLSRLKKRQKNALDKLYARFMLFLKTNILLSLTKFLKGAKYCEV